VKFYRPKSVLRLILDLLSATADQELVIDQNLLRGLCKFGEFR
jgi:hypothetical protein